MAISLPSISAATGAGVAIGNYTKVQRAAVLALEDGEATLFPVGFPGGGDGGGGWFVGGKLPVILEITMRALASRGAVETFRRRDRFQGARLTAQGFRVLAAIKANQPQEVQR